MTGSARCSAMKGSTIYCITVFLGAFLLFQVQPMVSKALLPLFGGSYLVWGSCMVFFQGVLLLGYLYAHYIQRRLGVVGYSRLHWLLLLVPFLFCPFDFGALSAYVPGNNLVVSVVILLLFSVGVPFFVLSTTSLVLQKWLVASDLREKENPYALYAASNLGSMLGLLAYPFVCEPFIPPPVQGYMWWAMYLLFVGCHLCLVPKRKPGCAGDDLMATVSRPEPGQLLKWFTLGAAGCAVLLAVTNVITLDVASVPFLWVLPLGIYLGTYVLAFKRVAWFPTWIRRLMPWSVVMGVMIYLLGQLRLTAPPWLALVLHMLILFVLCINCNGSLVSCKPSDNNHLTTFYLMISAGGFAGSVLVSWVVPVASSTLIEYMLALFIVVAAVDARPASVSAVRTGSVKEVLAAIIAGCLAVAVDLTVFPRCLGRFLDINGGQANVIFVALAAPLAFLLVAAFRRRAVFASLVLAAGLAMSWTEDLAAGAGHVKRLRNYYGIYKVFDSNNIRYLKHGTTMHGRQYISGPLSQVPMAYYHPTTPVGQILLSPSFDFRRIGMVGLGTGAATAYARKGQVFTVYELDPDNLPIAANKFTYLDIAARKGAQVKHVVGDGRISIGREEEGSLDLIIIDAFNSGAIPVHLMTVEAFRTYMRAVGKQGVVLLHVSNKVLNLIPVVYANAGLLGLYVCEDTNAGNRDPEAEDAYWMAITANTDIYGELIGPHSGWYVRRPGSFRLPAPWTDQNSNIMDAILRGPPQPPWMDVSASSEQIQ